MRLAMNDFKGVLIWLDPDKIKESIKIAHAMRGFGFDVRTVATLKDPKDYDDADLDLIIKRNTRSK